MCKDHIEQKRLHGRGRKHGKGGKPSHCDASVTPVKENEKLEWKHPRPPHRTRKIWQCSWGYLNSQRGPLSPRKKVFLSKRSMLSLGSSPWYCGLGTNGETDFKECSWSLSPFPPWRRSVRSMIVAPTTRYRILKENTNKNIHVYPKSWLSKLWTWGKELIQSHRLQVTNCSPLNK